MAKRDCWNRCDDCGKFISMADFQNKRAIHKMTRPDSSEGGEQYDTICSTHLAAYEEFEAKLRKIHGRI